MTTKEKIPVPVVSDAYEPVRAALNSQGPVALAIITDVIPPFYRPVGSMLCIFPDEKPDKTIVGNISSGCVEADVALHASKALMSNQSLIVRYGEGSPYIDIRLPCGGGMEVMILPDPDLAVLNLVKQNQDARHSCTLIVDKKGGGLRVVKGLQHVNCSAELGILFPPPLKILIFGDGPEASTFTALVHSAGYDHLLITDDQQSLNHIRAIGGHAEKRCDEGILSVCSIVDNRTAIVLFFHDHDREIPLLENALKTSAMYIGAQGSLQAQKTRLAVLRNLNVPEEVLARIRGPIGIIPAARDPRTLAISVLAEIAACATNIMP